MIYAKIEPLLFSSTLLDILEEISELLGDNGLTNGKSLGRTV
jgi:hypothetical protein